MTHWPPSPRDMPVCLSRTGNTGTNCKARLFMDLESPWKHAFRYICEGVSRKGCSGETCPECGQKHPTGWGPGQHQREVSWAPKFFSLCFQLPHVPPAMPLPPWQTASLHCEPQKPFLPEVTSARDWVIAMSEELLCFCNIQSSEHRVKDRQFSSFQQVPFCTLGTNRVSLNSISRNKLIWFTYTWNCAMCTFSFTQNNYFDINPYCSTYQ